MKAEDPTHPLTAARPLARAAAALACALAMASGLAGAGCAGSPARAGSLARAGSPVPASAISRLTVIGGRAAKACGDTAPLWMTAVLTTHAKALTSATPGDFVSGAGDVPVFLVTMRGNFVPTAASRPPGAPAPAGSYLSIVVDARTFQVLDSGISPSPPPVSPASLGPVTYLAGQCQEILTELDLPLDVAMTFNCVGEVHCAMGQFTKAGTCYAFAAEQSIACGGIGEQARAVKGQAVAASAAGAGERAKDPYQQAALLFCYYLRFVVVVVSNIISPISQVSRHQSACLRIDHRVCRLALGACLVACARPWVPGGCKQKECQP